MSSEVAGIQPDILRWARESLGLSVYDVAARLRRDTAEIEAWESGTSAPSYAQLETLAYSIYKRPIAVFFMPAPPDEPRIEQQFRSIPDFEIDQLDADTHYQLRIGRAFQLSLIELNDGKNPAPRKIFRDLAIATTGDVRKLAVRVREYLGVNIAQQASWGSTDRALNIWRSLIENAGVYVFKHAFKQKDISGFCLAHDEFPLIYLNNSTAKTRQIFSLFHELIHILMSANAITKLDEEYIEHLPPRQKHIERFCNAVAAEILIPASDFNVQIRHVTSFDDDLVEGLAARYAVSREVVLLRLLDRELVTPAYYRKKAAEWAKSSAEGKSGGNYYLTQAAYLGDPYLRLVFGRHYAGKLSLEEVADYLGVRTKNVAGIEQVMLRKATAE